MSSEKNTRRFALLTSVAKWTQIVSLVYIVGFSVTIGYFGGVNETVLNIVKFINSNYGSFYAGDPIDIQINSGILHGFKSSPGHLSRDGRPFYEFLGIPFAQPPIGELRFEPPVPIEPWEGVRSAQAYASKCLQFDPFIQLISGSEDCLYLNVFTPNLRYGTNSKLLPVIVFIHGGLFMFGRAELFRPDYMMDEDVVLVSIHYRLGALGFLNTGDNQLIRGNMGLHDQHLALKWVQENIPVFGGDPSLVTLLGESAGAASITYHMMSNASKGLFHRAITMSGNALAHWAFVEKPKQQAEIYASKLHCPTNDSREMVKCLKNARVEEIAELYKVSDDRLTPRLSVFVPTIESVQDPNSIVVDNPRSLLGRGQVVTQVPWLNGVNAEEGLIYAFAMLLNQTCVDKLNSNWSHYAPILFNYDDLPEPEKTNVSVRIRQFYMGDDQFHYGDTSVPQFIPLFSDSSFNLPLSDIVNYYSQIPNTPPMYLYQYSYRAEHAIAQVYFNMNGYVPLALDALITNGWRWIRRNVFGMEEHHYGVSHADELVILFQFPLVLGRITKESKDYEFSRQMIKIWTHFAKTGNPNDAIAELPNWPRVEGGKARRYMNLNKTFSVMDEPFLERVKFWKELF